MAYAVRYRFAFEGVNGSEYTIDILQKDYRGTHDVRALGRAPVLKKEKSGCIYGSSLELYAECQIDGEFAELYTSSADEFKVEVYKDGAVIWTGFVVPELYSEPDIAPPYDVQIIATDGLGELKNQDFIPATELVTIADYISSILTFTGQEFGVTYLSGMRQDSTNSSWEDAYISMAHMASESCYDVLQSILESFHASIMLQGDGWLVWRETDMMFMRHQVRNAEFGSAKATPWWPVGQLSTSIQPAKRKVTLESENVYKDNVFKDVPYDTETATYDSEEEAYVLTEAGASVAKTLEFDAEVGYKLNLAVTARNVGSGDDGQRIGIKVEITGRSYSAGDMFWLLEKTNGALAWSNMEGVIEKTLEAPSESDSKTNAQTIVLELPLYKYSNRAYRYADSVEVTVINLDGSYPINVYDVTLSKSERLKGYRSVVEIGNGAREEADEIELAIADSERIPAAAEVFMDGLALNSRWVPVSTWRSSRISDMGYLAFMSRDYALSYALPRMRVQGVLNVPSTAGAMPELFFRDETYYWLESYSYDLRNDEVSVNMLSLPTATIEVDDEVVTEMAETTAARQPSSSSSGGSSSGSSSAQGITNIEIHVGALKSYDGRTLSTRGMETAAGLTVQIAEKMLQGAYNKVIDNSDDYPAVWNYSAEKLTTNTLTLYFNKGDGSHTLDSCRLEYTYGGEWDVYFDSI